MLLKWWSKKNGGKDIILTDSAHLEPWQKILQINQEQQNKYEPPHDKTNKIACAPSKDSDQPGHPPSLIRVFAVRMKKAWVLSYPLSAQQILWSDWAVSQTDLRLHWAHSHFVGFVMRRLILYSRGYKQLYQRCVYQTCKHIQLLQNSQVLRLLISIIM